jgi:hypothetical protein
MVSKLVASTPEGLKDPADFIEARFRRRNCESFRREIVEPPATGRIGICSDCLLRDPTATRGTSWQFWGYIERVVDFFASSMDPADRTKRAW